MARKAQSRQQARSAVTGEWITIAQAIRNPRTTVIETVKHPKRQPK